MLLLLALLSACRASPWKRSLIYSQAGTAIYRETKHDEEGNQVPLGYAHPVEVPPEHLQALLGELKFTHRRWLLGDRSGETGPDERLRFLTSRYVWNVLVPSHVGNSGVIFATAPDRLHIAFDLVGDALPDEGGDARSQRFDTEPTEITDDKRRVLPPNGIGHHQDAGSGTTYPCWLVVDPASIAAISARVEGARAAGAAAPPAPGAPGGAPSPRLAREGYRGFNIIEFGGEHYGLAQSEGAFDISRVRAGAYRSLLAGKSVEEVIGKIDAALAQPGRPAAAPAPPRLVEEGYRGFNIIEYGGEHYGLAQEEGAFSIEKVRGNAYRRCVSGKTPEEAKRQIDRLLEESPR